jgi:hypothetical protein
VATDLAHKLYEDLCFLVLEGRRETSAILAHLPPSVVDRERAPRRLALRATLHVGDTNGHNEVEFAVVPYRAFTIVAPTGEYARTGVTHFMEALNRGFGDVDVFMSHYGDAHVARFEGGRRVEMEESTPEDVIERFVARLGAPSFADVFPRLGDDDATLCRLVRAAPQPP